MPKTQKHILVIRLSAMGDVAMTVPVLRAFSLQYPDVQVTILTREFFAPFFRDLPNATIFPIDAKGRHKGFLGLFKLSRELKKLEIEGIADLHNVLRTNILKLFFLGYRFVQIDKGRSQKKALVSGKSFQQLKTTHQRYADVFENLGFKIDLSKPTFPEAIKLNKNILSKTGSHDLKWVGIAPFAAYVSKMYPLDVLKNVIKCLSNQHKIFLFGGGNNEIQALNTMASTFDNVINLAGELSLDEELDVISNLDVMLSMDSGNAHLAAMLGKKVVTIWGVTHPFAGFAPFNQPENYALLTDREQFPLIPTSVYGNKYPENYLEASRTISPQQIVDKINSIL
jgi:ADP-heptose:LPS heptosyltransferase